MAASKTQILYALENSVFEFPKLPGQWDIPIFPGLRAHATPNISHLVGNMVGVSTLTDANADAVIAQVQEFFGKRQHAVGWWLNPSSTPVDLVSRLEAAGFSKVIEQAGQVLTDLIGRQQHRGDARCCHPDRAPWPRHLHGDDGRTTGRRPGHGQGHSGVAG